MRCSCTSLTDQARSRVSHVPRYVERNRWPTPALLLSAYPNRSCSEPTRSSPPCAATATSSWLGVYPAQLYYVWLCFVVSKPWRPSHPRRPPSRPRNAANRTRAQEQEQQRQRVTRTGTQNTRGCAVRPPPLSAASTLLRSRADRARSNGVSPAPQSQGKAASALDSSECACESPASCAWC
jgi:hypothetical protein